MATDGDGGDCDSGFKWILTRLGDAVRTKYCSQALHEELADVQTQLRACGEAITHAEQVAAAIASLEAAQDAGVRTQRVTQLLSELHALQRGFQQQMAALLQPFADTLTTSDSGRSVKKEQQQAQTVEAAEKEEGRHADQRKLLSKVQNIVSKRRRDTWLSDAVDLLREFVRNALAEDTTAEYKDGSKHTQKARREWKKFVVRAVGALRAAVLELAAEHEEQLARFLKALKKLAKHNAEFASFYEESVQLMAATEQDIAATKTARKKKKGEKGAKKKRKLSDASTTSSVPSSSHNVPEKPRSQRHALAHEKAKKLPIDKIRVLLTRCAKGVKLLRDQFTMDLFDQSLSHLEDIALSLSREFAYDDVSSLLSSLFVVVEHVEKVKQPVKRKNRLVRLEATLQALVDADEIPISNRRRAMVQEYRANCLKSLKQIQSNPGGGAESSSASGSAKATHTASAAASKAKKSIVRNPARKEGKRVKHSTPAALVAVVPKVFSLYPQSAAAAAAQQQQAKKKEEQPKALLNMGGHVRFDT